MNETEKKTMPKQVCTIRIMFPIESDEHAIAYKKKIGEVLADMPQARIEFSLMSVPNGVDIRPTNR